jgi:AAA lid domain
VVTFAAERRAAAMDEIFAALDRELIGLVPVKRRVEEIGSLLLVDRVRQKFGLAAPRPNLHMCFTGAPGTGKTTVGLLMSDLLHRLGYLQVMENQRDKFIVILAGYQDRMETFFDSNPGLRSRIAHHLDFADYQIDELVAIGRLMLERASYYLSGEAETVFRHWVMRRMKEPLFANARTVRNDLERARLRHAYRLAADQDHNWSRDDLMRLEAEDIQPANGSRPGHGPPVGLAPGTSSACGSFAGDPAAGPPDGGRLWPGFACAGRYSPRIRPYSGWSSPSPACPARSRSVVVSCSACAADRRTPRTSMNGSGSAAATSAASARNAASVAMASS